MYSNIVEGIFLRRITRFTAEVLINKKLEIVHVKNTGRCKELLIEGQKCYLEKSDNPSRKTKYSLISIYKNNLLFNIDSQVPNKVIYNSLMKENILSELKPTNIELEKQYKNSRFDIKFNSKVNKKTYFLEVKGVTLESNNIAQFPDAPTLRGNKHILELMDATKHGYGAIIVFLIQFKGAVLFHPNFSTDPRFADNLKLARKNNVQILAYDSIVEKNTICLNNKINVEI